MSPRSPNPEVPEILDRAEVVAREHQAHLVLATDPDADRIGALACLDKDGNGDYRFITGNEIAALLLITSWRPWRGMTACPLRPLW